MSLCVNSEIGKLKRVLVHLPGPEIDTMVPSMMGELLFDDILYGNRAREEHRRFQQLMLYVADEVLDAQDLLEEVLAIDGVRREICADLEGRYALGKSVIGALEAANDEQLARFLVAGIARQEALATEDASKLYDLAPLSNFFFMRDPAVVCGDRVFIGAMASAVRRREPLLSYYIFKYHPALAPAAGDPFWEIDPKLALSGVIDPSRRTATFEGGDLLVAREDLLLVGLSQRTNRNAVDILGAALQGKHSAVKKLLLVDIPDRRATMHLDTVFTFISASECLAYMPVIDAGGPEEADVYEVDLTRRERSFTHKGPLLEALGENGIDLRPVPCGGHDPIQQQREQWTDGANAFALAPGVIMMYERNVYTAESLAKVGYEIVYEDDLLLGRTELELWDSAKKYAIQIQGHELSRARGGPRCMTQPLVREPLS